MVIVQKVHSMIIATCYSYSYASVNALDVEPMHEQDNVL